jgi:hypothetical protein
MSPILGIIASSFRSAAGPDGAYDALATITVPSGGLASITFAGIPNTYKHLQIRGMNLSGVATGDLRAQFNSDTGSNYSLHYLAGDGASTYGGGSANTTYAYGGQSGSTTNPAVFVLDILDYSNTSKNKTTRTLSGYDPNGSGGWIFLGSGNWRNTNAITSVTLFINGFNVNQYSQFSLYGVK